MAITRSKTRDASVSTSSGLDMGGALFLSGITNLSESSFNAGVSSVVVCPMGLLLVFSTEYPSLYEDNSGARFVGLDRILTRQRHFTRLTEVRFFVITERAQQRRLLFDIMKEKNGRPRWIQKQKGDKHMSRDEAKKIPDPIAEALLHDAQHHLILHAYPGAGMSYVNVFWLVKFIEQEKEREWQRHS